MIIVALLLATQVAVQDPRLERLDPETRSSVIAIVDSAREMGLPSEPLVQRALEGARGRSGPRIVAAVRRLAADLGTVRTVLGARASTPELEAAVARFAPARQSRSSPVSATRVAATHHDAVGTRRPRRQRRAARQRRGRGARARAQRPRRRSG